MESTDILSDLCNVCYTEKPKYRCPRCKAQTCSLACYKRHQQRASCDGQRNPAAFVKKSQWATPAGIDHDYNYLKSVERRIESASEDVQERGIGQKPVSSRSNKKWHPDGNLQCYLAEHRIDVERAPVGMSRQRANKTRVTPKGNVFWTVEWIDEDDRRTVEDDCLESSTLSELHAAFVARQAKNERRRQNAENEAKAHSKKRKRDPVTSHPEASSSSQPDEALIESTLDADTTIKASGSVHTEEQPEHQQPPPGHDQPPPELISHEPVPNFYLLRPGTASNTRVLIPCKASNSLTACLAGHSVQEFPTIYILPHASDSLPSTFQLEGEYIASRAEAKAMDGRRPGSSHTNDPRHVETSRSAHTSSELQANDILDMLKRDVGLK